MRSIKHPIFLGARDYTSDFFWKKVFENLAYGDPPKGVYIKDSKLYSLTKKKEFSYDFSEKDSEQVYTDVHQILSKVFGLKCKSEQSRRREMFDQYISSNSSRRNEDVWSRLKRKTIRDNLLQDYVISCKNKYELSDEEVKKLYFYVSVGPTYKLFSSSDIHLVDGVIDKIDGINISQGAVTVDRTFTEPSSSSSSHPEKTKNSVYIFDLWKSTKTI
jgi:hypothetical protein